MTTPTPIDSTTRQDLNTPLSTKNTIRKQSSDAFCRFVMSRFGQPHSSNHVDKYGIFVFHSQIDGALQTIVPQLLSERVLFLSCHPPIAGHPGMRLMYDTLGRDFYCVHVANGVYGVVNKCKSCARNCPRYRHKRLLQVFFAMKPLDFVAMDILGSLSLARQTVANTLLKIPTATQSFFLKRREMKKRLEKGCIKKHNWRHPVQGKF